MSSEMTRNCRRKSREVPDEGFVAKSLPRLRRSDRIQQSRPSGAVGES
jgi:hypothetical protein